LLAALQAAAAQYFWRTALSGSGVKAAPQCRQVHVPARFISCLPPDNQTSFYTRHEEHRREIQNSEEDARFKRFRLMKTKPGISSFASSGLHQFRNGGDKCTSVLTTKESQRLCRAASAFFYEFMAGIDDDLVDLVQQFRDEQADVVLQRLVVVRGRIERSMAEHLAQGVVLADQFVQMVVIDVQVKADDAADEDRLECHAGMSGAFVDARHHVGFQQREELRTRARVLVEVLQAAQNLWNVVA
jgi:hypothetical protein